MTDLGLTPSLCHLGEYPLQKYTLLHLCVIVPNLAEMFLLGHLQNSISSFPLSPLSLLFSLFPLPSSLFPLPLSLSLSPSLARVRALQEFCFFAVTSVTGDSNGLWFSELWVYLGLCSCLPYFLCGVCAKNHSKHTKFSHPFSTNLRKLIKKQSVDWRKTTRRFWKVTRCFSENDLSFFEKWPVVFCKSTCCFMKRKCTLFFSVVTLVTAKNAKSL